MNQCHAGASSVDYALSGSVKQGFFSVSGVEEEKDLQNTGSSR